MTDSLWLTWVWLIVFDWQEYDLLSSIGKSMNKSLEFARVWLRVYDWQEYDE